MSGGVAQEGEPAPEPLAGGVANAGAVFRIGDEVQRPAGPHAERISSLLRHLQSAGFHGAPVQLRAADSQERLRYIPGDVATPPYPAWAQTDEALASVARLLRPFHVASQSFPPGASRNGATR